MASEEGKQPHTNGIDDGQNTARASQSQGVGGEIARPNNFQRIAQKKMLVKSFPRQKKLEKLAVYNSCKVCWHTMIHMYENYDVMYSSSSWQPPKAPPAYWRLKILS